MISCGEHLETRKDWEEDFQKSTDHDDNMMGVELIDG